MGHGDTGISPEALLEHRGWLQRLAVGLVGDAQTADDLVQETLVTALSAPPEHADDPPRLRAWLARVVRRASLQRARGEARRTRRQAETARGERLPPTDALVARAEMQRNVADAVLGLHEPYRTVVLLRYFEGLDSAEIARRLGAPAATVRSRLMRGLDLLRVELDRRYGGDRAAWCVVIAAFLPQGALAPPAPVGDGVTAPLLKGALAVKGSLQIVLACAAVVAAAVGAWKWSGVGGGAGAASEERALEADVALAEPEPVTAAPLEEVDVAPERLAVSADEEGVEEVEPDVASAPARAYGTTLDARVVDEAGVGIVGARLEVRGPGALAHSGAGGDVALDVPLEGERRTLEVSVGHPGRATAWLSLSFRAGEPAHLGEVVLAPAGTLTGRVVDEGGRPLAEVEVVVDGLENARRDPEQLRRLGPELGAHPLRARSEADGGFRIEGVPVGSTRVWAGAEGFAWSGVGPVEVRRERETGGVEIELAPLRLDDRIEGVVLGPDGAPVEQAQVRLWYVTSTHATSSVVEADAEGRFSYLVQHRVPHDLTVMDPYDRWSELHAPHVEPGERDLVLRFVEPSYMEVVATAADGAPVLAYEVRVEPTHDEYDTLEVSWTKERPEGRARLRRPTEAFTVRIEARGYERWRSEVFPAESRVETVPARLVALPGLSGTVLRDGEPVAGARVALLREVGPRESICKNDFFCTLEPGGDDETLTDSQGRFRLYPDRDGRYHVLAQRGTARRRTAARSTCASARRATTWS